MQGSPLANGAKTQADTDWTSIDWHQAERQVRNLRQRIFRATQREDWKTVHSLQKLMLRSYANRKISVRRVTQVNKGRNTPGVDKLVLKTPAARGRMVDVLGNFSLWQAQPARRVYIPKASGKLRPLGIPVIIDRCLQMMVKNALEPSWEARFEGCSYGFRPGRDGHDAIEKIFRLARPHKRKKWVLDADIRGAFDNIDHDYLLETIGPAPARELIKQWLKAGYVDQGTFHPTEAGTPQGGVISPLLANIALHGMEAALGVKHRRGQIVGSRALVRYADDFCVFCESREDAEAARDCLEAWLKVRGLEFSSEKTRIVHLTEGIDFLGFHIRLYPVSTTKTGWKLLTTPSKKSIQKHRDQMKEEWQAVRGWSIRKVLWKLNPIIRGWANYFRTGTAKATFRSLDDWTYSKKYDMSNGLIQTSPRTGNKGDTGVDGILTDKTTGYLATNTLVNIYSNIPGFPLSDIFLLREQRRLMTPASKPIGSGERERKRTISLSIGKNWPADNMDCVRCAAIHSSMGKNCTSTMSSRGQGGNKHV